MLAGGTQYVQYKNKAFENPERQNKWEDLHIKIDIFGLNSHFFPLYEVDIIPWR